MPPGLLAEFELLVMLAALRIGPEEAYTVSIADDIEEKTGRSVRGANVYTTIQRLEAKGLLSTCLGAPRPERGGKQVVHPVDDAPTRSVLTDRAEHVVETAPARRVPRARAKTAGRA